MIRQSDNFMCIVIFKKPRKNSVETQPLVHVYKKYTTIKGQVF